MTAESRPTFGAVERLAAAAARMLALFGLGLLLLFAVATLFDGALRGLLNHPIESVRDLGGSVVSIAVACCLPLGLVERSNISIKVIDLWLPPAASRVLDALAAIVVQVIIFFIALEFYWYARDIAKSGETTLHARHPEGAVLVCGGCDSLAGGTGADCDRRGRSDAMSGGNLADDASVLR